jgi:hypothetical protein
MGLRKCDSRSVGIVRLRTRSHRVTEFVLSVTGWRSYPMARSGISGIEPLAGLPQSPLLSSWLICYCSFEAEETVSVIRQCDVIRYLRGFESPARVYCSLGQYEFHCC